MTVLWVVLSSRNIEKFIDALNIEKGVKDLTIIANDTGYRNKRLGDLFYNQVKKL